MILLWYNQSLSFCSRFEAWNAIEIFKTIQTTGDKKVRQVINFVVKEFWLKKLYKHWELFILHWLIPFSYGQVLHSENVLRNFKLLYSNSILEYKESTFSF